MKFVTGIVAWIYDFLAEDMTLVVGLTLGVLASAVVRQVSTRAAAIVLCISILLTVGVSVARTAMRSET